TRPGSSALRGSPPSSGFPQRPIPAIPPACAPSGRSGSRIGSLLTRSIPRKHNRKLCGYVDKRANNCDTSTYWAIVPGPPGGRGNRMTDKDLAGGRSTDFSRSPVARYIQLATLFRNRIATNEWPVGSRIPNVDELAKAFSVARGTMREALGLLEKEGLLEWKSLNSAHEDATIELLDYKVVKSLPAFIRDEGRPAPKYRMMRRLYVRDARPYLVASVYIDEPLFRKHADRFRKLPALPMLRRVAAGRVHRAWQRLTVGAADIEVAGLLQMPLNAPTAHVDRVAIDRNGVVVYSGHGVYRGDAIRMEAEMR